MQRLSIPETPANTIKRQKEKKTRAGPKMEQDTKQKGTWTEKDTAKVHAGPLPGTMLLRQMPLPGFPSRALRKTSGVFFVTSLNIGKEPRIFVLQCSKMQARRVCGCEFWGANAPKKNASSRKYKVRRNELSYLSSRKSLGHMRSC